MSQPRQERGASLPLDLERALDPVCRRFEAAWRAGGRPRIEDYLADVPALARPALLNELLRMELEYRRRDGERPSPDEYRDRFPAHEAVVCRQGFTTQPPASPEVPSDGGDRPPSRVRRNRLLALQMILAGAQAGATGLAPFRTGDRPSCAAPRGNFPDQSDRDNLWHLLLTLTARKALRLQAADLADGGGGGDPAACPGNDAVSEDARLEEVIGGEPTPKFAAQMAEECQRLLAGLDDPGLRSIAVWRMEGYGNEEIAARLGCLPRTVERKLGLIRALWRAELDE
jgi:hypothetical protein